jgi:tetratricopeptide (TPR) repeat protein
MPMSHYLLGAILERQTNTTAAIECYRKCLELDPDHSSAKARLDALVPVSEG